MSQRRKNPARAPRKEAEAMRAVAVAAVEALKASDLALEEVPSPDPGPHPEDIKALHSYLAECVALAKRVDSLINQLGEAVAIADNTERMVLYTAAQRLGITRLPAPSLSNVATASAAEAVRILRAGGVPMPYVGTQGAADRLKFLIEQTPILRPDAHP